MFFVFYLLSLCIYYFNGIKQNFFIYIYIVIFFIYTIVFICLFFLINNLIYRFIIIESINIYIIIINFL